MVQAIISNLAHLNLHLGAHKIIFIFRHPKYKFTATSLFCGVLRRFGGKEIFIDVP